MTSLIPDKRLLAVVRKANQRRVDEAPLLAWAGMVKQETVDDRIALRIRVTEGSFWRHTIGRAAERAAELNRARWLAFLCSQHPAAPPDLFERLTDRTYGPPEAMLIRARRVWAKLLSGFSIDDDFRADPAPWFFIRRKHWLRLDVPPEQRKADAEAEIATWQAEHPEETAAWRARYEARQRYEAEREVIYHDGRFAA